VPNRFVRHRISQSAGATQSRVIEAASVAPPRSSAQSAFSTTLLSFASHGGLAAWSIMTSANNLPSKRDQCQL
jgi:hypothetical protein